MSGYPTRSHFSLSSPTIAFAKVHKNKINDYNFLGEDKAFTARLNADGRPTFQMYKFVFHSKPCQVGRADGCGAFRFKTLRVGSSDFGTPPPTLTHQPKCPNYKGKEMKAAAPKQKKK